MLSIRRSQAAGLDAFNPRTSAIRAEGKTGQLKMRDPHVERLFYRLHPSRTVTFEDPPAITEENLMFRATLNQGRLTVEMKEHHPYEDTARARVEEWLRAWEIGTCLENGIDYIRFEFESSEVIDRNPPVPGESLANNQTALEMGMSLGGAWVHVTRNEYPLPPKRFKASPEVNIMWLRYQRYKHGKEPLPSMAYFCLKVIEESAKDHGKGNSRQVAGTHYKIDEKILDNLGRLTSTRGSAHDARKYDEKAEPLTESEIVWIEAAIRQLIERKARFDYEQNAGPLEELEIKHLPALTTSRRKRKSNNSDTR